MRTGTFRVDYTLWDALTVKVCKFLNQMHVLQQYRTAFAYGE
jgi:hypothetical protein